MMVNSRFIGQKVFIDIKWSLNWTICHNLCLNLGYVLWNRINFFCIMKIFFVLCWISCCTWLLTFWSWLNCSTWFKSSSCMMITRGKAVRFAPVGCVVKPSSWKTSIFYVGPSSVRPSTIASHTTTNSTATYQILGWNSCLLFLSTCNTNSVAESFNSAKCPTRATCTLISDLLDWFTIWPLLTRVKALWKSF